MRRPTMSTALLDTEIKYNRANRDYDILICGQYVASAANYSEAETIRTRALSERRDEGCYDPTDGTPGIDDNAPGSPPDPDPAPGHTTGHAAGRAIARHFHSTPRHFVY